MRILLAVLMASAVASPAWATVILYDGFDYTVEQRIIGQTNPALSTMWIDPVTSPSQPGPGAPDGYSQTDPQVIVSSSVGYGGLATPTGNSLAIPRGIPRPTSNDPDIGTHANIARIVIPTQNVGNTVEGKLYYSFTLQLDNIYEETDANARGQHSLGGFLAGFHAGPLPTSQGGMSTASTYGGQLRIRRQLDYSIDPLGLQTGMFEFGLVKNNAAGASTGVAWDETQAFDIASGPIFVVGSYQFIGNAAPGETDDEVKLWLNPTPGEAEGDAALTSTEGTDPNISGFYNLRSFWLRSDSAYPGDFLVDELRIGQTYADVTPAGPAGINGDFNDDQVVDGADVLLWQRGESPNGLDSGDLQLWKDNFGGAAAAAAVSAIPEPGTGVLAMIAALSAAWARHRVKAAK